MSNLMNHLVNNSLHREIYSMNSSAPAEKRFPIVATIVPDVIPIISRQLNVQTKSKSVSEKWLYLPWSQVKN